MRLYGLTGGVGMGKSTCAMVLAGMGVRVVDTDDLARSLTEPGHPAVEEISHQFGPEVIDSSGRLNRSALAQIVFNNSPARAALESILHPRIIAAWKEIVAGWRREGAALGVVVIPLLFETEAESHFVATVCVACSKPSQQLRLSERGWNPEERAGRIAAQLPIEDKMARSDYVIWSEGEPAVLLPQIERIFQPAR
jgi:dephospho-CoA kinase